jgi:hypothetical protein
MFTGVAVVNLAVWDDEASLLSGFGWIILSTAAVTLYVYMRLAAVDLTMNNESRARVRKSSGVARLDDAVTNDPTWSSGKIDAKEVSLMRTDSKARSSSLAATG